MAYHVRRFVPDNRREGQGPKGHIFSPLILCELDKTIDVWGTCCPLTSMESTGGSISGMGTEAEGRDMVVEGSRFS